VSPDRAQYKLSRRQAMYTVGLLSAIALFNGIDLSILPAVSSLLQREFSLADYQVGALGAAYVLVYAFAVIPFGVWSDGGARRLVVGFGVMIWSLATAISAATQNFAQLVVARGAVGFGEASYLPAGNSLVGDLYPREQRARALSFINAAFRAGIAFGVLGGAALAAALGWRAAFLIAALPGFVLGFLALRLREPGRGAGEAMPATLRITGEYDWGAYRQLLRIPTVRPVILAVSLCLFVSQGAGFWMPLYLQRHFGIGVAQAGAIAGLPLLVGGLIGTFGGGWIGDWRARKTPRGYLEVAIASLVLAAVALFAVYSAPTLPLLAAAWFFGSMFLSVWIPVLQAQVQLVVIPVMRASGITLTLLAGNLFGNALAPPVIGGVSGALHSLSLALLLLVPALTLVAALSLIPALSTAAKDSAAMDASWRARLQTAFAPPPA
jgi:MFS family permease